MILNFYAVKDELANRFLAPTLMNSEAEAKRQFKSQINNINLWKDNASDFSLFALGTYNDETGELICKVEKITGGRAVLN